MHWSWIVPFNVNHFFTYHFHTTSQNILLLVVYVVLVLSRLFASINDNYGKIYCFRYYSSVPFYSMVSSVQFVAYCMYQMGSPQSIALIQCTVH